MQAVKKFPNMNRHFAEVDGKPNVVTPRTPTWGLAIDLQGKDGKRRWWSRPSRAARPCLSASSSPPTRTSSGGPRRQADRRGLRRRDDLADQPGHHRHRALGAAADGGQGAIIGAGAMEYPAEFQGASEERIAELGVGKLITLTSTYDHRIIQGAESGDFLRTIHHLLLDDEF